MSAMQNWGVGGWVVFGISAFVFLAGLYQLVFAARIEAGEQARREAEGAYGGGYQPRIAAGSPRVIGMIFLGFGAFGMFRQLVMT
jgi:hypothetical protein